MTDTLHLILTHKWYDAIESGEKKVEYRKNTPIYLARIKNVYKATRIGNTEPKVCFHRAYTNTTLTFKIRGIIINGAQIEIHLGEKL